MRTLYFLIICLGLMSPLFADLTIYYDLQDTREGQTLRQQKVLYATDERIGFFQGHENAILLMFDKQRIVYLHPAHKRYVQMSFAEYQAFAQYTQAMKQYTRKALQNLPKDMDPATKQKILAHMGQVDLRYTLKRTRQTAKHLGYPCQVYHLLADGQKIGEVWVTKVFKLKINPYQYMASRGIGFEKAFANLSGVILKLSFHIKHYLGPQPFIHKEIAVKVSTAKIRPSLLMIPYGYTKQSMDRELFQNQKAPK